MNAATSSPPVLSAAASQAIVLKWLAEARPMLAASPVGPLLDYEGIDLFDAALAELSITMLAVLRRAPTSRPLDPHVSPFRMLAYGWKQSIAARRVARLSQPPVPSDILLWSRDITHTVVLHPVMQALVARGVSARMLACQPRVLREVRERTADVTYAPAAWPGRLRAARRKATLRIRELDRLRPWPLPQFEGRDPAEFEPAVRFAVTRVLPAVLAAITNLRTALDTMHSKVVVVGNDLTVEGRVGCRAAAQRGVPSAVLMHGTITGIPMNALHCADRIFVFGETHRRELLDRGIADERIVISGDPNLDGRPRQSGVIHPDLKNRLGLVDGKPWILVATSGPGHRVSHGHHEQVVASLGRLAAALPDVPLVIKLHAKDKLEYYQALLGEQGARNVHVIPRGAEGFPTDIYSWLHGASMIVTGASTTAIEAMFMEVPVITMDYCQELADIDFIEAGATLHCTRSDELEAAVRQVIAAGGLPADRQPRVADFLRTTYYALDGRASERVAESLSQLGGLQANS